MMLCSKKSCFFQIMFSLNVGISISFNMEINFDDSIPCLDSAQKGQDSFAFSQQSIRPHPLEMTLTPPWPQSQSVDTTFVLTSTDDQYFLIQSVKSIIAQPSPYISNCMQDWSLIPWQPLSELTMLTQQPNSTSSDSLKGGGSYSQIVSQSTHC